MGQTKRKLMEANERKQVLSDIEYYERWQLEDEYNQQLIEAMEASQYKH